MLGEGQRRVSQGFGPLETYKSITESPWHQRAVASALQQLNRRARLISK